MLQSFAIVNIWGVIFARVVIPINWRLFLEECFKSGIFTGCFFVKTYKTKKFTWHRHSWIIISHLIYLHLKNAFK